MPNRARREDSPHREAALRLARGLKEARQAGHLSQQELASRAGVAIGTVRALESERSIDPSFFTVMALARVLRMNAGELFDALN